MAVRRLAEQQPDSFAFSEANLAWAKKEIEKYPVGRQASAVIALLWRAQEQEGWVTEPAIRAVAEFLDMPTIRVLEVATFYTMFNLAPVGRKAHVQVCGTTPCWLRGADDIKKVCRNRIHQDQFHVSGDGDFSWEEVECLGACVNAPMVLIGSDTYEDLTAESFETILDDLAAGRPVKPGTQIDRQFSAPVGGPTTLTDPTLFEKAADVAVAPAETGGSADQPGIDERPAAEPSETASLAGQATEIAGTAADRPAAEAGQPEMLSAPRDGKPDDLKRIKGVGLKIEGILNQLGIYHYDQIAAWSAAEVEWVDERLKFKGRIARENWIEQAKTLAAGGATEFSRRSDAGAT